MWVWRIGDWSVWSDWRSQASSLNTYHLRQLCQKIVCWGLPTQSGPSALKAIQGCHQSGQSFRVLQVFDLEPRQCFHLLRWPSKDMGSEGGRLLFKQLWIPIFIYVASLALYQRCCNPPSPSSSLLTSSSPPWEPIGRRNGPARLNT